MNKISTKKRLAAEILKKAVRLEKKEILEPTLVFQGRLFRLGLGHGREGAFCFPPNIVLQNLGMVKSQFAPRDII